MTKFKVGEIVIIALFENTAKIISLPDYRTSFYRVNQTGLGLEVDAFVEEEMVKLTPVTELLFNIKE